LDRIAVHRAVGEYVEVDWAASCIGVQSVYVLYSRSDGCHLAYEPRDPLGAFDPAFIKQIARQARLGMGTVAFRLSQSFGDVELRSGEEQHGHADYASEGVVAQPAQVGLGPLSNAPAQQSYRRLD